MQVDEVLSENGNMSLHNQQGVQLVLGFEGQDVSARTYWFEIANGFRKQLVNGTGTDQKTLDLGQGELATLLDKISHYVIVDETEILHELIMEGKITVRGF